MGLRQRQEPVQADRGSQIQARELPAASGGRSEPVFLSTQRFFLRGRVPPPGDRIHDPLLDQYSREIGAPRGTVTQHDPGYEAWVTGRPLAAPPAINITVDLPVQAADPAPDYSQDENQLGAWERANFLFNARQLFSCDHVVNNGVESSFVTDVGIRLTQERFEYFIARHIFENMNDRGREASERITWRAIHGRILTHAREHFTRYRQVVNSMRQVIQQRFAALPTRHSPVQISQSDLETYVRDLLAYLVARLHFELWQATCDWERRDYPTLLRGIAGVQGTFRPACDPRPVVPPEPVMPLVVTPGASPPSPPARRTRRTR